MERTTIMLPNELKLQATQYAKKKGISMGELIRNALTIALTQKMDNGIADDPLFSDSDVFCGSAPTDISGNHDEYLYGKKQ